jgi:predicted DCC family thiol-disulfide oxidoreductase YuxK
MDDALRAACGRAVHALTPAGRRYAAGRAVLLVLAATGHRRLARALARWPLIVAVEGGYWLVARNRHRLGCLARLLDDRTSVRDA